MESAASRVVPRAVKITECVAITLSKSLILGTWVFSAYNSLRTFGISDIEYSDIFALLRVWNRVMSYRFRPL